MGLTVTGVTAISAGAEPSGQQVEHPYGADAGQRHDRQQSKQDERRLQFLH